MNELSASSSRAYSTCRPQRQTIPAQSAEIFRQWLVEARLANFTKHEYAAAFEDFRAVATKGDCVLQRFLCDWTRLLREENRARVGRISAQRELPEAA